MLHFLNVEIKRMYFSLADKLSQTVLNLRGGSRLRTRHPLFLSSASRMTSFFVNKGPPRQNLFVFSNDAFVC